MRAFSSRPDTSISLREHLKELATLQHLLAVERDRRYAEVSIEREKALRIKEIGDAKALELERATQAYKDEKANELREQINSERLRYASKEDLSALADKLEISLKPIADFVAASRGGKDVWSDLAVKLGVAGAVIALIIKFVN